MGEQDRISYSAGLSSELGIQIAEIFLPASGSDMENWPVIACDQYTSSPEYWDAVSGRVSSNATPSAFHLVLPEIYLEHPGAVTVDDRISAINRTMRGYLDAGILQSYGRCMILVDRSTLMTPSRLGLVFAIDLDAYDFQEGRNAHIRATEGTVLDRIPPRLRIRQDAALEIPHVMLLADDPDRTIIEPLAARCALGQFESIYDMDLPEGGGHITGYRIPADSAAAADAIIAMSKLQSYIDNGLLFAVGDGNHSLATAKSHWENIRSACPPDHPARFALVELVNIYDAGLSFEPIHRIVFGVSPGEFTKRAPQLFPDAGIFISEAMSLDNAVLMASTIDPSVQPFTIFRDDSARVITFHNPPSEFTAGTAQMLIDGYIGMFGEDGVRVDYIHGTEDVAALSSRGTGILLPSMPKDSFFDIIAQHGALPRKTFSMGEASEKRYYMECKKII
ncbi:MAG: DUF1015 domain-containing protein [Saccharofermentanales bacterium]